MKAARPEVGLGLAAAGREEEQVDHLAVVVRRVDDARQVHQEERELERPPRRRRRSRRGPCPASCRTAGGRRWPSRGWRSGRPRARRGSSSRSIPASMRSAADPARSSSSLGDLAARLAVSVGSIASLAARSSARYSCHERAELLPWPAAPSASVGERLHPQLDALDLAGATRSTSAAGIQQVRTWRQSPSSSRSASGRRRRGRRRTRRRRGTGGRRRARPSRRSRARAGWAGGRTARRSVTSSWAWKAKRVVADLVGGRRAVVDQEDRDRAGPRGDHPLGDPERLDGADREGEPQAVAVGDVPLDGPARGLRDRERERLLARDPPPVSGLARGRVRRGVAVGGASARRPRAPSSGSTVVAPADGDVELVGVLRDEQAQADRGGEVGSAGGGAARASCVVGGVRLRPGARRARRRPSRRPAGLGRRSRGTRNRSGTSATGPGRGLSSSASDAVSGPDQVELSGRRPVPRRTSHGVMRAFLARSRSQAGSGEHVTGSAWRLSSSSSRGPSSCRPRPRPREALLLGALAVQFEEAGEDLVAEVVGPAVAPGLLAAAAAAGFLVVLVLLVVEQELAGRLRGRSSRRRRGRRGPSRRAARGA